MQTQNIFIFSLLWHFASAAANTNMREKNDSLVLLDLKIKSVFSLPVEPKTSEILWPVPTVLTITAEASNTSNEVRIPIRWPYSWRKFGSLKVNVTNLSRNKTILVSNVKKGNGYIPIRILLEDSFQVGDHLEIVVSGEFPIMKTFNYYDYDTSTNRNQTKFYGIYKPFELVPMFSYDNTNFRSSLPRVAVQFTVGLTGVWSNSHKIIGSFNPLRETNHSMTFSTRWTHMKSPPLNFLDVSFFISEFVNYTVCTERSTKVSVWGPPSIIFENGTTNGRPTVFANYTVSFASSLLNNYEKILEMKYPLDGLEIISAHATLYKVLGQIHLIGRYSKTFSSNSDARRREAKRQIKYRLSHGLAIQFFGLMVDEPFDENMDLRNYVHELCGGRILVENFHEMNLINMLESFLPPEIVLNGIRTYFKSHIWKRATESEFFDAMEKSICTQNRTDPFLPTGTRVKDVIGNHNKISWFNRQVNASLLSENNQIQLTFGFRRNSTHGFKHWFPVQIELAISLDNSIEILGQTFWIAPNTTDHNITTIGGHTLTSSSKILWVLINKNRNGLYTTFYDRPLLSRLATQLNRNCSLFSPNERFNILIQGGISYRYPDFPLENFFILTSYFGQETDTRLWKDVLNKLVESTFLYMANDKAYEETRNHFVPKIESYMKSKGGLENIVHLETDFPHVFEKACVMLRTPSCLRFASENMKSYELTTWNRYTPWFQAAGADPRNFEYLEKRFLNLSDDNWERMKYFVALGWTNNDTLYETFLNSVVDANPKALFFQRGFHLGYAALSESRLSLLINFANTKFHVGKIPSNVFARFALYIFYIYRQAEFVSDKYLYNNFKLFINLNQEILEADEMGFDSDEDSEYEYLQRYITRSDEKVNKESFWNKNGKEFLSWLKGFNEGYTFASPNYV